MQQEVRAIHSVRTEGSTELSSSASHQGGPRQAW